MCGLFGIYFYGEQKDLKVLNLSNLVKELGRASAIRGTDATGIAYVLDGRKLEIDKRGVSAYQFKFDIPSDVGIVMGHTRASTHGSALKNYNNHPFRGKAKNTDFAFAHNGVLDNYLDLRISEDLPNTKIEVDSYVAVQLLEKYGELNIPNIKKMAETVVGSFTFTILDEKENLYVVKNDSPFVIAHFPTLKLYAYASTDSILIEALMHYQKTKDIVINTIKNKVFDEIELIYPKAGEILVITKSGSIIKDTFKPKERFSNIMWWNFGYKSSKSKKNNKNYDCSCDTLIIPHDNEIENDYKDNYENDAYNFIMQVAEEYGYYTDEIQFLLDVGYTEEEIYDLIMTDELNEVLIEELGLYYGNKK
jgi:glucosamine 6-phosphate synthetase-like amidotransferase/phosphosugar isomerase protein